MNSENLIIWLIGVEYPNTEMLGEMTSADRQTGSQIQSLLTREMGEIISRSDDFKSFELVPTKHGETNLMLSGDSKRVFVVCCSHYSNSQFLSDLNAYNPDLTVFVRQPKGISRSDVSKFAQTVDMPLMLIKIPKLITNKASNTSDESAIASEEMINSLEKESNLSGFLFKSPETKARALKTLSNVCSAIYKIAKFTANLLEAWNRGCKLFELATYL